MEPKLDRAKHPRRQKSSQENKTANGAEATDPEKNESDEDQAAFLIHAVPPWIISMLVHVSLILVLAILTIAQVTDKQVSLSLEPAESVDEFEQITVVQFEELNEIDSLESLVESEELNLKELESPVELETTEFAAFPIMDSFELADELGTELDLVGEEMGTTRFFGKKQAGQKFVFVVDNSNSMTKGKFETALIELNKTIDMLKPEQEFHVIFFSDTAYLMHHPDPVKKLVYATEKNKERLRDWLYTVEMCLKTKGEDAMKAAIAMQPDVIYILGDGAFTDKTEALLTAPHKRKIVINTLGMQVAEKGAKQLTAIAKANNGKYRAVDAAPTAIAMAKRNPINRNRTRGRVWGMELPSLDKKK